MNTFEQTAKRNHGWGANVTCIGGDKRPSHRWKHLQSERQSWDEAAFYPWGYASGTGVMAGINGWRCFDVDDCDGPEVVVALLSGLGLLPDYRWVVRTGSGHGWHVWVRCDDRLPGGILAVKADEPGVFVGLPKGGYQFDHIELRWERCQTLVPPSKHTTGPGYKYANGEPTEPPTVVRIGDVLTAFLAVAVTKSTEKEPAARTERKARAADAAQPSGADDCEAIRQRFDLRAYALKHYPGKTQEEDGEIRILGHGGLLLNLDEGLWRIYRDYAGGDCFDLVGYVKHGDRWNRHDAGMFRAALQEAADFAGVTLHERRNGHGSPSPTAPLLKAVESDVPASFHCSDLGNASRFAAQHKGKVRYCHTLGKWLHWDDHRWATDDTDSVMRLARDTVQSIYQEAADADDPETRKVIARWALASEGERRMQAMVELAKSDASIAITHVQLDADPWALNCANGTIDLLSGELRPHNPADLLTKLAPVEFHPDARLDLLDRFLTDATGDDAEFAGFLRRVGGYSATGETWEEIMLLLLGPSNSGKTTVQEMIAATLGDYALAASFKTFLESDFSDASRADPDVARLAGARFVRSSESNRGKRINEDLLKKLTGGDKIVARFLHQNPFEFRPMFKLWLSSNYEPKASHDDDALWRRIIRLPFVHSVPAHKRDPGVKRTLTTPAEAGSAILRWLVDGCLEWQRDGLDVPDLVKQATEEYRESQDPLRDFLDERCILTAGAFIPGNLLREEYEQWARENGEQPVSGKEWGRLLRLQHLVYGKKRHEGRPKWGWNGIGLRLQEAQGDAGL